MTDSTIEESQEALPLIEHLIELRRRVMLASLALLVGFAVAYGLAEHTFAFLVDPLRDALGEGRRLIFTGLPEAFLTKIKLALFTGFLIAFPFIAAQVYLFIAPALYKREKFVVLPYMIAGPLLFFAGAALAYFYVFPAAWQFFVSFEMSGVQSGLPVELEARISEYLSIAMQIIIAFGLAFQLPVLLTLMVRFGFLSVETLRKGRKFAVVIMITLAAVLTPPDVFSQIGLFACLYALYEVSIVVSSMTGTKREP
jgi:sec-independent protein translocase protein TatC